MTKKFLAILIGLTLVFSAGSAFAGSTNGTANYSVTLTAGCIVDTSAATTDFGSWFIGDPNLVNAAAGSVSITCASTLPYAWGVNRGSNPNLGVQSLRMHNGTGQYITYNLLQGGTPLGDFGMTLIDGSYSQQWTTNTDRDGIGTGAAIVYPLNANVQISGGTVAGLYTDTVTVTVVW